MSTPPLPFVVDDIDEATLVAWEMCHRLKNDLLKNSWSISTSIDCWHQVFFNFLTQENPDQQCPLPFLTKKRLAYIVLDDFTRLLSVTPREGPRRIEHRKECAEFVKNLASNLEQHKETFTKSSQSLQQDLQQEMSNKKYSKKS